VAHGVVRWKVLVQMNSQLHTAIADLTRVTGLRIVYPVVRGDLVYGHPVRSPANSSTAPFALYANVPKNSASASSTCRSRRGPRRCSF